MAPFNAPPRVTSTFLTLGLLLAASVIALALLGFRITYTGSVPVGLYRLSDKPPARGAIVLFCLPDHVAELALMRGYVGKASGVRGCDNGTQLYGKPVLALPGDTLTLHPEGLAVNGVSIPNSRPMQHDRAGRELPHPPWGTFVVEAGSMFLYSPYHAEAFDSRYYGPVPESLVVAVAEPILVW